MSNDLGSARRRLEREGAIATCVIDRPKPTDAYDRLVELDVLADEASDSVSWGLETEHLVALAAERVPHDERLASHGERLEIFSDS